MAAQSGHDVTMVDMTDDILKKTTSHIEKSLSRVAKKQFKDDSAVRNCYMYILDVPFFTFSIVYNILCFQSVRYRLVRNS